MDVEKIAVFAGVGFAVAVGAFVLWGPSPKPRRRGKVIGINNLGYTCFLNALLQALAACPTFSIWLQRRREKNNHGCFTNTLASVFEKINGYDEEMYGDVTPIDIISSLGPLWSFAPGHQDTHELFHIILSALQGENQRTSRTGCLSDALPHRPMVVQDVKGSGDQLGFRSVSCNDIVSVEKNPDDSNGLDRSCNGQMMTSTPSISSVSMSLNKPGIILARSSEILSRNTVGSDGKDKDSFRSWNSLCAISLCNIPIISYEVHPFSGLLTSQLQCTNCKWKSSVRYDKLESISLPLPLVYNSQNSVTLEGLFSRFVTSEVVNDVQCDGCGLRCQALKTLTLGKLPKCLCLHIPRTTWSPSGVPIKRDDFVIFPEVLVLDPFTFTEAKKRSTQDSPEASMLIGHQAILHGKQKYRLRAVIEHCGPVDSGHFVCYRRGNRDNKWLFTSDTMVEHTSLTNVLCAIPYLLFYERYTIDHSN